MEDIITGLLSSCFEIDFGVVNLSEEERRFCKELNDEIVSLCGSLPRSTQTEALLSIMQYWGIPFDQEFNFFRYYYIPSWSIIYWLIQSAAGGKGLEEVVLRNAKAGHSMAMFLHPFDDHLNDHEIPAIHLTLLLRSQSWMIMNHALYSLADGVDGGNGIVRGFLDDYYSSIRSSEKVESLDSYCDLFRKQMATWFIAPALLTKRMTSDAEFTDAILTAYGSFGIAWRLLDDIKDLKADMMQGKHSSIYVSLPDEIRDVWNKGGQGEADVDGAYSEAISSYILESGAIETVRERLCSELESAASIVRGLDMAGLANEFDCLLRPLRISGDHR